MVFRVFYVLAVLNKVATNIGPCVFRWRYIVYSHPLGCISTARITESLETFDIWNIC